MTDTDKDTDKDKLPGESPVNLASTVGISAETVAQLSAKGCTKPAELLLLAKVKKFPENLKFISNDRDRDQLEIYLSRCTSNMPPSHSKSLSLAAKPDLRAKTRPDIAEPQLPVLAGAQLEQAHLPSEIHPTQDRPKNVASWNTPALNEICSSLVWRTHAGSPTCAASAKVPIGEPRAHLHQLRLTKTTGSTLSLNFSLFVPVQILAIPAGCPTDLEIFFADDSVQVTDEGAAPYSNLLLPHSSWSAAMGPPYIVHPDIVNRSTLTQCIMQCATELEDDLDKHFLLCGISQGFRLVTRIDEIAAADCFNYKSALTPLVKS